MTSPSRSEILAAIRKNKPEAIPRPALRDFSNSGIDGDVLALFKQHLREAEGTFYRVGTGKEISALIKQLHPDAKVVCSATPEVKGNRRLKPDDDPHSLADIDVGIFRARFGVAENGAVWVTDDDLIVTALSVLSEHLIVLLDPAHIVTNMHCAYKQVALHEHHYGCFMMGPSATADIGAVHVNGAQGARSMAVVFV
jgi:L-lactate dehydrogenase complex protein LldG